MARFIEFSNGKIVDLDKVGGIAKDTNGVWNLILLGESIGIHPDELEWVKERWLDGSIPEQVPTPFPKN
jgi:hypothetical protein